jgi:hypothetical protein
MPWAMALYYPSECLAYVGWFLPGLLYNTSTATNTTNIATNLIPLLVLLHWTVTTSMPPHPNINISRCHQLSQLSATSQIGTTLTIALPSRAEHGCTTSCVTLLYKWSDVIASHPFYQSSVIAIVILLLKLLFMIPHLQHIPYPPLLITVHLM